MRIVSIAACGEEDMGKIQKSYATTVAITTIAAVTLQLPGTSAFAANAAAIEGGRTTSSYVTA